MKEPFDIEINGIDYAVFPEEGDVYTIFKDGEEFVKILKDTENHWLKLDNETDLPLFIEDEEVNRIGREIEKETGE
ncbi:hypothetical protein GS399_09600 [Pedobacter sp. HMF7647]|uniref:Uncharacterized protein n=1 Tax=Hufsiella arboris TaxID=2695275 RepID=A0A7K1Y9G4_9SPHI|nr:hypothetical protein [Hufsiella arboris]MXV51222.1 hypothetical protein [Hufsiella arboris]